MAAENKSGTAGMTADKDLVSRLRNWTVDPICLKAADRIEQLEAQLEATAKAYGAAVEDYNDLLAARAESKSDHLNYAGSGRVATSVKDILNSRKVQQQVTATREMQNAPPDRAEPDAYVVQSLRDGSIGSEIAPTNYAMFDKLKAKLEEHSWVKAGVGKVVPLYLAPPACAPGGESGYSVRAIDVYSTWQDGYALGFQEAREAAVAKIDPDFDGLIAIIKALKPKS